MSRKTRNEYLETMRCRYRRYSGKQAKGKLLDEFCRVTKHERKYASKLLSKLRDPGQKNTAQFNRGGRPKIYDTEVVSVIFEIWKHSEQPCGKRLVPMLKDWLPFYEKRQGILSGAMRNAVLSISASQIDRVLGAKKIGGRKINRRTPKTNAAIKALVPIRAQCWDAREPGWIEADTVAHCGGDMGGSFLWSLTATDIYSGWTEVRSSWNRGQHSVCTAFEGIEGSLPFAMLGVDTDNGGEFLNYHLHRHFTGREKPVEMTRSRPYQKNDQAHVEQKNSSHVRQLLGHDRLGHDLLVKPIDELSEAWSVWRNCFTTTFKQIEKRREGSKTVRKHEKVPKTPCDRLIDYCDEVGDKTTAESLRAWKAQHDPFELKAWIEKRLKMIWRLDAALNLAESEGETDLEGAAAAILSSHLRSAPVTAQNRKLDQTSYPQTTHKTTPKQDATVPT
ncbi:MAG: integrase [Verrucomicrobia bacterium]|nr:integrase [Verrucomicrobiota bacterium]